MPDSEERQSRERREPSSYQLVQQQSQFYQSALEAHRIYVLQQIDGIKNVIGQGVSKDELRERLETLRKNVEADIERVQHNVTGVSTHLESMEQNILTQMNAIHQRQADLAAQWQGRQKDSLKRIITIQATILMFILTTTIALVLNFLFHFIGAR